MSYPNTNRHLQPVHAAPDTVHEPPPLETVNGEQQLIETRRVVLTPAAGVRLRPTFWLWDERVPQGAITVAPGREGIGKSLFCSWLAARVTHGELPGVHYGAPKGVVYAATEDSWERTLAGRLTVAGADLNRVFRVDVERVGGDLVPLSLPRDCASMAAAVEAHDVALLIVDPLISAVDPKFNVNQDRDLREALEPLVRLADDTGCSIFGLAHFNKASGTDVLSRIMGGRAFSAVARSVVAFARDTRLGDGTCVISQVKNNLGRLDLPSLRYSVESVERMTDEGPAQWGRLRILEETDTHVNDLLDHVPGNNGEDTSDRAAIQQWLTEFLAANDGAALMTAITEAGTAERSYSVDQLKRAKSQAGVISRKRGNAWWWHLPDEATTQGSKGARGQEQ